ncbi:hypothetical protein GCM10027168_05670 [Streptomyces capparidis]
MAVVVAQEVPTSSIMSLPHGPAGVGRARRRLRDDLLRQGAADPVVDDAVLILSELLSNSARHARPLYGRTQNGHGPGQVPAEVQGAEWDGHAEQGVVKVAWHIDVDGLLTLEVTDGGGPTRPRPSSPSLTARGGRGLGIVGELALQWGVRDAPGEVTVWAVLPIRARHARREGFSRGFVDGYGVARMGASLEFD